MDKRRKVYRLSLKRGDALRLWDALNNVTSSQAGSRDNFYAIAALAESIGDYFAFTAQDAEESRYVPPIHDGRAVFLYE